MNWDEFILNESKKEYYKDIIYFLKQEAKNNIIYPSSDLVYNAFNYFTMQNTKVLILGQDPYINPNQANGLSFSVPNESALPPSLSNIFKELKSDLNIEQPHGNLEHWAKQGVLLLNSSLTVRAGESNSHATCGWQIFTDKVIQTISNQNSNMVFILWGAFAQKKKSLINSNHLILEAPHPSPLSAHRGFFGSKPFSKTNAYLIQHNMKPIDWQLI